MVRSDRYGEEGRAQWCQMKGVCGECDKLCAWGRSLQKRFEQMGVGCLELRSGYREPTLPK